MATIEKQNPVTLSQSWGVAFSDYAVGGKQVDFQDLMVAIAQNRAVAVEGEVAPLSTRIRIRNKYLEELGQALAEATDKQAGFESDDKGDKVMSGWFSATATATMVKAGCSSFFRKWSGNQADATKAGVEGIIQKLKSVIDGQNNQAQTDMTRLQSLVDRRDESYSTATNLMTQISDTRSNLIRNL
jgi:hypothetical protein